jgi:hypothetical protein
MCTRMILAALTVIVLVSSAHADDAAEIARFVKQLGDENFDKREAASKRLAEIGEPALDALHMATTSDDAEVRRRAAVAIADIERMLYREIACFTGHTESVWSIAVSADGNQVISASGDQTVRLWDVDTGKCLRTFEGHTNSVTGVAMSADGKRDVLAGRQAPDLKRPRKSGDSLGPGNRQGAAQVRRPHRFGDAGRVLSRRQALRFGEL